MDPVVVTTPAAFADAAMQADATVPVPVEVRVAVEDPFEAYRRVRDETGGAYLATTGGQSGWGYFGVDPVEKLSIDPDDGSALDAISSFLGDKRLARGDCSVPYPRGAIGWLSYDIARELESLPDHAARDRDLPRLQLAHYDRLAAWREPRDGDVTLRVTACPTVDTPDDDAAVRAAYERGQDRALDLAERIETGDSDDDLPPPASGHHSTAQFESDCGKDAFTERVKRVKSYVRDGDTFQANISQRLSAPAAVHPVAAFDALRAVNPAPYSALLEFPGLGLVSASPELLLERDGDSLVTEPIAGTRPRGDSDEADAALEVDLESDEKERAEHAMLVDLERNDLGKVSEFGSVEVTEYRRIDRYSEVMHLVSEIRGRLRDDADLADAIGAVFPGGTITGAPKPRTMEIIDELEATRRGPYTGSIGVFGFDGRALVTAIDRALGNRVDLEVED